MDQIIEILEIFLHYSVEISALVLEIIGVFMMILSAAKAVRMWSKHNGFKDCLTKGIPRALEFLMCAEVLKTTTANSTGDYINLAVIIAIRFALAAEIHWEQKQHAILKKLESDKTIQTK